MIHNKLIANLNKSSVENRRKLTENFPFALSIDFIPELSMNSFIILLDLLNIFHNNLFSCFLCLEHENAQFFTVPPDFSLVSH